MADRFIPRPFNRAAPGYLDDLGRRDPDDVWIRPRSSSPWHPAGLMRQGTRVATACGVDLPVSRVAEVADRYPPSGARTCGRRACQNALWLGNSTR